MIERNDAEEADAFNIDLPETNKSEITTLEK
jgi:hypothetical protein